MDTIKLRLLTAIVLIPLFVLAVVYLGNGWFALLMATVIALAAWEWAGISGYTKPSQRGGYTLVVVLLLGLAYGFRLSSLPVLMNTIAVFCWFVALGMVLRYQKHGGSDFNLPIPAAVMGVLVLVPPWTSVIILRGNEPDGVKLVLFLLVLIWSADISAYFCGRRWGRRKLCDRVSPGKSREGVYGALITAIVLGLVVALYRQMQWSELLIFITICLLTVLASILGDLLESVMKRMGNVKDSGTILPGHGGVLDRIDSLTAALPVFVSALWLWEQST